MSNEDKPEVWTKILPGGKKVVETEGGRWNRHGPGRWRQQRSQSQQRRKVDTGFLSWADVVKSSDKPAAGNKAKPPADRGPYVVCQGDKYPGHLGRASFKYV